MKTEREIQKRWHIIVREHYDLLQSGRHKSLQYYIDRAWLDALGWVLEKYTGDEENHE